MVPVVILGTALDEADGVPAYGDLPSAHRRLEWERDKTGPGTSHAVALETKVDGRRRSRAGVPRCEAAGHGGLGRGAERSAQGSGP